MKNALLILSAAFLLFSCSKTTVKPKHELEGQWSVNSYLVDQTETLAINWTGMRDLSITFDETTGTSSWTYSDQYGLHVESISFELIDGQKNISLGTSALFPNGVTLTAELIKGYKYSMQDYVYYLHLDGKGILSDSKEHDIHLWCTRSN